MVKKVHSLFVRYPALRQVAFFFPIQLVMVHLKKNHLMMLFWVILFGFVTKAIAPKYGIPFLFLDPEYLDNVSFFSFLIVGFSCGGFIMAFNISSYIMNAFRFPFLATLSKPFVKYCLNNFIIPAFFCVVYLWNIVVFQKENGTGTLEIFLYCLGFVSGVVFFLFITFSYFFTQTKDLFAIFGLKETPDIEAKLAEYEKKEDRDWHIETYLSTPTNIRLCRKFDHYEKSMLMQVFRQNNYAAATFEIIAILSLLILGFFREVEIFMIPAGASIILLFTMFMMLMSALHTWLRGWSTTAFIVIILVINALYQLEPFNVRNSAYGMKYNGKKASYDISYMGKYDENHVIREHDVNHTLEILNKWRRKNSQNTLETKEKKPKMVFICTSGGGLRSTMWTFHVLQYADRALKGQLLNHTSLITGSSGGMIGAAYLRELYLETQNGKIKSYYEPEYLKNASKDLLNPVAFTVAASDLFFRFQHFNIGEQTYTKDRAYAFEKKLNENMHGVFRKKLSDYKAPEEMAQIPMMVFTPVIINDGRKLYVASQPISYLIQNSQERSMSRRPLYTGIEFTRFFSEQGARDALFSSVLRMNSTFPYIMPVVTLPSEPAIEVMDAGIRDNYGIETTLKFMYTFRNWISSNTSGVVILQIRDRHKNLDIEENPRKTIGEALMRPLGTFYSNTFSMQDYNHNQLLEYCSLWFDGKVDVLDFQLRNDTKENISLSWHLTHSEKERVINSIELPENQNSIRRLKELFEQDQ